MILNKKTDKRRRVHTMREEKETRSTLYKYDIFISYKHEEIDKATARYLQKALEQYHIPKEIQKKTGK